MMRIIALSYIGAEEDIVEQFVRHTLQFVDKLHIVSTEDGPTRHILMRLRHEGLPIDVIPHTPVYHDQHEILTTLLRRHRHDAEWFLPIDSDEFLIGDIRAALEAANSTGPHGLRWRTYVPLAGDDLLEPNILKRIRHRRAVETPQFTKIVIPSSAIRWSTGIGQGNHTLITRTWFYQRAENWGTPLDGVYLAHIPVRSTDQMERKIARSWPAVARNPKRLPSEAFHWKQMYKRYSGRPLSASDLTNIALRYSSPADAPVPDVVEDPIA
jgi:hypothetical protein